MGVLQDLSVVSEHVQWNFQDFAFLLSSLESALLHVNQNQSLKNHVKHKNAEIVLAAVMAAIHVHFVQYALVAQVVSVISVNTAKMVQMDARNNARKAKRILFAKPVLQIVLEIY